MTNQVAITMLKNLEQSLNDYCELNDEGKTAFSMAITALELFGNSEQLSSAQLQWIPVSERPPEYEMDVLLQFTSNMCVGFFHPTSESWIIWSGGDWCTGVLEGDEEPIAWMPLPEPYKENKE